MCFTVNVNLVKEELESRYGSELLDPELYTPSYYYHAFAFPELPTLHINDNDELKLRAMKWGLIPNWVSSSEEALDIRKKTPNARSETVAEKPSFEEAFASRRCIVPVRGFYEWQKFQSTKRPWYIYGRDESVLSLAGIFDIWTPPASEDAYLSSIVSFSILTTAANSLLSEIHNTKLRMPVIIPRGSEEDWIRHGNNFASRFFISSPEDYLIAHTVNPAIGRLSTNANSPDTILPYHYPEEPTLF